MSTRDRILDAAAEVMRTLGLARATTKQIARAAGYSEAALYKHFRDKTDLFLAVLTERMAGDLGPLLGSLPTRAAERDVVDVLRAVARAAVDFYGEMFPMAASLFAEPTLLEAHRLALRERGAGPQHVSVAVAAYLERERDAGRIRPDADPSAAAALLVGACLQYAFLGHFTEPADDEQAKDRFAAAITSTLLAGLTPVARDT